MRYLKFKEDAYQAQLQGMKFRHTQVILHEMDKITANLKKRPSIM